MSKRPNILMIIETGGPGGGEQVFLYIARNIDREQFNPSVILFKKGWLYDQLSQDNIKTTIISSRQSWDLSFLYRLIRSCRQQKIDIIHSHFTGTNLYACLVGAILRIPVVTTFHNELILPWWSCRHSKLKHFLIRNLASRTVLVAEFMKKDYINIAKYPPEKLLTIYNGIELGSKEVDFNISTLRKDLGIQDNELVVGHVANLRPPKGHRYLIEAAGRICKDSPKVKFLLIGEEGDGKIKREIEELITKFGLHENIKLLGFRDDVQKLLYLIDVFVLSSTSEGLPLSVVEAMAASKPVVATSIGGLPEIIIPNQSGYLVEPGNSFTLAEKLSILLRSKDLREQMGKMGRKTVEEKFSLETMIDNYQNLYKQILK